MHHAPVSAGSIVHPAPRTITLWGIHEGSHIPHELRDMRSNFGDLPPFIRLSLQSETQTDVSVYWLGRYTYNNDLPNRTQVYDTEEMLRPLRFKRVVIEVESNWGFPQSTCIYRVYILE